MRLLAALVPTIVVLIGVLPTTSSATMLTRVFHGEVTLSFVTGISAGEQFAAALVYDDEAPFSCRESFDCSYPAISLQIAFENGGSLFADLVSIHVETGNPSSVSDVFTAGGPGAGLRFEDTEGIALPGGADLPDLTQLNSPAWNTRRLSHTSLIGQPLQGDVFLVTPEPSTAFLLASALLSLAASRKRRGR